MSGSTAPHRHNDLIAQIKNLFLTKADNIDVQRINEYTIDIHTTLDTVIDTVNDHTSQLSVLEDDVSSLSSQMTGNWIA